MCPPRYLWTLTCCISLPLVWTEICGTLLLTHNFKTITAVFATLIVNAQLENQDDSSSATVCSEHWRSTTESDTVKADVSLAKRFTSPLVKAVISFMNSENRRGLKIAPCGTPAWFNWRNRLANHCPLAPVLKKVPEPLQGTSTNPCWFQPMKQSWQVNPVKSLLYIKEDDTNKLWLIHSIRPLLDQSGKLELSAVAFAKPRLFRAETWLQKHAELFVLYVKNHPFHNRNRRQLSIRRFLRWLSHRPYLLYNFSCASYKFCRICCVFWNFGVFGDFEFSSFTT